MPSIDVTRAPDRFLTMSVDGYAPGRNRPGNCARWVYFAINAIPNTTPLPSAIAAWENAPLKNRHPIIDGQTRLPAGAVVALGATAGPRWPGDKNWMFGDVVIATGEGVGYDSVVIATDSLAGTGVIGRMTIRQRIAQTGRALLGFLSSYGGWELKFATPVTPSPAPITPTSQPDHDTEDEDMRFTVAHPDPKDLSDDAREVTVWIGRRSKILSDFKIGSVTYTVKKQIALLRAWYRASATSAVTLSVRDRQAVQKILRSMK